MGSSSTKKKIIKIDDKKEDNTKDIEDLEEINITVEKSQIDLEKSAKEEMERIRKEKLRKEEFRQKVLKKIKEEEIIIKTKMSDEEFTTYIINFIEQFIQIYNSIQKKNSFIPLVFEFNKKYIYTFNTKEYPDIPLKESFFEILKYSSLMVVCLVFLSKDLDLHKKYCGKMKEPLEKFIYSIINTIGRSTLKTKTINTFIKNSKKVKKGPILCINDAIKLLFTNGKNVDIYKNLKNALTQVLNNIISDSTEDVMITINESILFFYNASSYIVTKGLVKTPTITKETTTINTKKNTRAKSTRKTNKKGKETKKVEEKKEKPNIIVSEPFIKEPMTREFCLVLDIDETISHTMRLSFGNYFLIRPGVIHLIKKLYHFYEIDIFTAAIQRYADNLVDKLDPNNTYINYRFYREHCIYEGSKSVKKLVRIGRELNKIVFVDNIKYNAKYNMDNLFHVSSWKDDIYDKEINKLLDVLVDIIANGEYKDDIRKGIYGKDDQVPPPD